MRILLTGAAGTLGRPLQQRLAAEHECFGLDLQHGSDYRCDIREYRQLERVVLETRPDIIFHFAAEFGRKNGTEFYEQLWTTNVLGTQNVIQAAEEHDCGIVFASSSEVYGQLADEFAPLTESLTETCVPRHHNLYALSKWTNERQLLLAATDVVVLRIFNVYGPGENPSRYRSVIVRLLTEPVPEVWTEAVRQFLFVDDFVETAARIPDEFRKLSGLTMNVAGRETVTMGELARLCGVHEFQEMKDGTTVKRKVADTKLAEACLGHAPKVTLAEGICRTRDWLSRL